MKKISTMHYRRLLAAVVFLFSLIALSGSALACWQTMLQECFERDETDWPWQNPPGSGRQWRHVPGDPQLHWGPQDDFFNNSICPPEHDTQSCWCIGDPRTQDPEFDDYPANFDSYMTFGPFNLVGRSAARVTFYYLNASEQGHDSLFWGAANSPNLTNANMQIAGSFSGTQNPLEYQIAEYDLSNLRNFQTHDSVSMLDSAAVYIFWRFRADNNNVTDIGAFVDEVVVRVDDGCLDLFTNDVELYRGNGRPLINDPAIGDTLYAVMDFATCDGAVDATYPAFRAIGTVGMDTVLNELIQGADRNQRFVYNTIPWIVTAPGDFNVVFTVDALGTVDECNENNNLGNASYHVEAPNEPPQFTWITPGTDSLRSNGMTMLRWECHDPGEQATINLYFDFDNFGCEGIAIPSGSFIAEQDGPDSLEWNQIAAPIGSIWWPYAVVTDAVNTICVYPANPIVIVGEAAADHGATIPQHIYLAQNYPNPFNPETEIAYGINKGGAATLRVYDLLGRTIATLVNRDVTPGHYVAHFNANTLSSGLYFYVLTAPEGTLRQKMMLLK